MAPTDYRDLGPSSLSRPFVSLLQISANNPAARTGRKALLYNQHKSLCTPHLRNHLRSDTQFEKFTSRRLQNPDSRRRCSSADDSRELSDFVLVKCWKTSRLCVRPLSVEISSATLKYKHAKSVVYDVTNNIYLCYKIMELAMYAETLSYM
jgi:hypothetical protein